MKGSMTEPCMSPAVTRGKRRAALGIADAAQPADVPKELQRRVSFSRMDSTCPCPAGGKHGFIHFLTLTAALRPTRS
jgi:hypothetical protein